MRTQLIAGLTPGKLKPGVHAWYWPRGGGVGGAWRGFDGPKLLAQYQRLGLDGIIPQLGDASPLWCEAHAQPFVDAGIQVTPGFGRITAGPIERALDLPYAAAVMLDEEDWHKIPDEQALAAEILTVHEDAPQRCVDAMYPAVVSTPPTHDHPHGTSTGHDGISRAFSQVCAGDRYSQCYLEMVAIPDGAIQRWIEWSRDPSQWPSIGVPVQNVRASAQMYKRSVNDQYTVFEHETASGAICAWDIEEMDPSCEQALLIRKALRDLGFAGVDGAARYQVQEGLPVGPLDARTSASLGVPVLSGVIWRQ